MRVISYDIRVIYYITGLVHSKWQIHVQNSNPTSSDPQHILYFIMCRQALGKTKAIKSWHH